MRICPPRCRHPLPMFKRSGPATQTGRAKLLGPSGRLTRGFGQAGIYLQVPGIERSWLSWLRHMHSGDLAPSEYRTQVDSDLARRSSAGGFVYLGFLVALWVTTDYFSD